LTPPSPLYTLRVGDGFLLLKLKLVAVYEFKNHTPYSSKSAFPYSSEPLIRPIPNSPFPPFVFSLKNKKSNFAIYFAITAKEREVGHQWNNWTLNATETRRILGSHGQGPARLLS
jgi:hypothetical protein